MLKDNTKLKQAIFTLQILLVAALTYGQQNKSGINKIKADSIVLKDTLFNIVTDSFSHNFGEVPMVNKTLIKYFKYIGTDTVFIVRTWTGDPHFICKYPKEPLFNGKIYSISICFYFEGRQGKFYKVMGFDLSNGNRISFKFLGIIAPNVKRDNK